MKAYEDKAYEYVCLGFAEKAIHSLNAIFDIPRPNFLASDDVLSQKLNNKFSIIKVELDALKSSITSHSQKNDL